MLTHLHPPPDETPTLSPISLCFCTPASSSPQLTILMLLQGPHVMPPTPPSPTFMPPLTCLILSATYHPYTCGVPTQHPSDASYHPYAVETTFGVG
ncbi:hypothetical protein O181_095606 [Austropuccinia psidii MF-1]|uniref:Uncharacterized protein n=1 Tax=Austropuccinia psidii MF-1 TaxID=1389203 RepID=A0A9Q3PDH0_9BASI|nr:hypothetical protein [Austropuccinia psidii MF-1]